MNIMEMRMELGDTQREFAARYEIPFRTIQNWEAGVRKPAKYIIDMLTMRVKMDLLNRKTASLPSYDAKKKNLPNRKDYIGNRAWLIAVQNCLGSDIVFALDEALMCQEAFGGHNEEEVIWVYGNDAVREYNGVVVLGNNIHSNYVKTVDGLRYTDFNRTIIDALANESILDMQGTTEALSRYYYSHSQSLNGIFVPPEYQESFERLSIEAIEYYEE